MFLHCLIILLGVGLGWAADEPAVDVSDYSTGSDIASFMSRPEIRPPKFHVTQHEPGAISPGYWFVAPYSHIVPAPQRNEYRPCQVGPHIYDNQGTLIWSGACMFKNRDTFDFKSVYFNGTQHLSLALGHLVEAGPEQKQTGIVMNTSFEVVEKVTATDTDDRHTVLDIHDFNIIEDGKNSLWTTNKVQRINKIELGLPSDANSKIGNGGFREEEIATGEVVFEWDSLDHLTVDETYNQFEMTEKSWPYWDYLHINSVDKFEDGDYLISARYTSCIYRISAEDGSIIWRLGGKRSDFELLDGFNFSSQHNARVQSVNETTTVLSFLNNASDNNQKRRNATALTSSAMLVALDTASAPMTARIIKQWDRPDGGLTDMRGSAQILPDGGAFVGWSAEGYLSEFTADGRLVLEAKFLSPRYKSYRLYKFNFTGSPTEPPALKTYAYSSGSSVAAMVSVSYVSWNGATEVAKWNFYGSQDESAGFSMIGSAAKSGFETSYMSARYVRFTYAEAISADGRILGKSDIQRTILPNGLGGTLSDLTAPSILHDDNTETETEKSTLPLARQSVGPITVLLIAIILAFALLGMAAMAYFLWNRKILLSGGFYAPVTSSDSLDSSELSALAYHDQEAEK